MLIPLLPERHHPLRASVLSAGTHLLDVKNQHPILLKSRTPCRRMGMGCQYHHLKITDTAVEHLIKIGKRRIAHLAGPENLSISRRRLNGYYAALRKYEIPIDEELIISYDLTMEKVNIYMNHLLNLPNPPDALFAINDPTAIEAIQIIKERGLKIPEDIAVVGFSNDQLSGLIEPSLTTVSQPVQKIGETAAEMLLHLIKTDIKDWKAITKTLTTELIIRKSTVA